MYRQLKLPDLNWSQVEVLYGSFNISLQARFAAVTITNTNIEMLALIKKHHTLDQRSAAVFKRCQPLHIPVTREGKKTVTMLTRLPLAQWHSAFHTRSDMNYIKDKLYNQYQQLLLKFTKIIHYAPSYTLLLITEAQPHF